MLAQGIYPERMKFSLIKPIYESGDKSSPSNYRPIYLLRAFSKIFENVIYKRLFDNFNNNAILNEHQYGFQSEVSTENASCILLHEILTAINCKQMVGGIFCDLHKAFDCFNHAVIREIEILLSIRKILQFSKIVRRWKIPKSNCKLQ